jgi:putative ATPase
VKSEPLAEKVRPGSFDHFYYENNNRLHSLLTKVKQGHTISSLLFYGPPGVGKTSLARLLGHCHAQQQTGEGESFFIISAANQGVKELREILTASADSVVPLIFVDEIHRFTRTQQDFLLPLIESGKIICIGATTEAPSFFLSRALLSRMALIILDKLSEATLLRLVERIAKDFGWEIEISAALLLCQQAGGDARKLLNMLEELGPPFEESRVRKFLEDSVGWIPTDEELHYQVASAFIKSLRGSDADAALYYGFRMLESGEDARFLFRRLVIFASEDIGNADPRALGVALDCASGFERVGLPEGRIPLAQAITYLAGAPKSNRSYVAMKRALALVEKFPHAEIPKALRNPSHVAARMEGAGNGYEYPHDHTNAFVPEVSYLPESLRENVLYEPSNRGYELRMLERWNWLREPNKTTNKIK